MDSHGPPLVPAAGGWCRLRWTTRSLSGLELLLPNFCLSPAFAEVADIMVVMHPHPASVLCTYSPFLCLDLAACCDHTTVVVWPALCNSTPAAEATKMACEHDVWATVLISG